MKKLNLSEWAKLAELVSAGAVINSLLYVGYQIKENSRKIRAVNRQESVNRSHSASLRFATSPEFSGVPARVSAGTLINPTEQRQQEARRQTNLHPARKAESDRDTGRFNRAGRREARNAHVFELFRQVRVITRAWIIEYKEKRPRNSLKEIPPATFRRQAKTAS